MLLILIILSLLNYNLCRISGIERLSDMLSLNRALNPFTLYNSSYLC